MTENPNHKMPKGKPLDPETAVPEGDDHDAPSGETRDEKRGNEGGSANAPGTEKTK